VVVVSFPVLATCTHQLKVLANKYSLIHGIRAYTVETIRQIREAWESILIEMDTKLTSYAENNAPGTVAADFLELLMFGVPSPQLEHFLRKDMTEKGLKKLGQSIELSYSNIQRLVLRYLGAVSQSLNFQLGELLGLATQGHKLPVLGLTQHKVEEALQQAQAFWAKGVELQQVIDESMKNFKAFFRWVYVEILRLCDETASGDLSKVCQQDVTFIAEFLKRFQPVALPSLPLGPGKDGHTVTHLHLEKVGQYLEDKPLSQPPDNSANPWHQLLKECPEIQEVPEIIPVNTGTSLIQEYNKLSEALSRLFTGLGSELASQAEVTQRLELPETCKAASCRQQVGAQGLIHGLVTMSHSDRDSLLVWVTDPSVPSTSLLRLQVPLHSRVIDTTFYTSDLLSLLLEEEEGEVGCPTLLQLPLGSLAPLLVPQPPSLESLPCYPAKEVQGARSRVLDSLPASQLAVSGPKKVSVFLFKNRKKIRIYDMEGEEEEEEDTLESSGFSTSMDVTSSQIV